MSHTERNEIYMLGANAFFNEKPDDPPFGYGSDIQKRCLWSAGYFDAKRGYVARKNK